jgi:RNA-binding protein
MSNSRDNRRLRRIGHHLQPVVTVAEHGLTPGLVDEASRALEDHELIKVRLNVDARPERRALAEALATDCHAEIVQIVGKVVLLFKRNPQPNPGLSNLSRFGV